MSFQDVEARLRKKQSQRTSSSSRSSGKISTNPPVRKNVLKPNNTFVSTFQSMADAVVKSIRMSASTSSSSVNSNNTPTDTNLQSQPQKDLPRLSEGEKLPKVQQQTQKHEFLPKHEQHEQNETNEQYEQKEQNEQYQTQERHEQLQLQLPQEDPDPSDTLRESISTRSRSRVTFSSDVPSKTNCDEATTSTSSKSSSILRQRAKKSRSVFSILMHETQQYQKLVSELESVLVLDPSTRDKVGECPEATWRARILIRSAQDADRDLLEKLNSYEKSLLQLAIDVNKKCGPLSAHKQAAELRMAQTSFNKMKRDFDRSHKTLHTYLNLYEKRQKAEVNQLSAVNWLNLRNNNGNNDHVNSDTAARERNLLDPKSSQSQRGTGAPRDSIDMLSSTTAVHDDSDFFDRKLRQMELERINQSMKTVNEIYGQLAGLVNQQQEQIDILEGDVDDSKSKFQAAAENIHWYYQRKIFQLVGCGGGNEGTDADYHENDSGDDIVDGSNDLIRGFSISPKKNRPKPTSTTVDATCRSLSPITERIGCLNLSHEPQSFDPKITLFDTQRPSLRGRRRTTSPSSSPSTLRQNVVEKKKKKKKDKKRNEYTTTNTNKNSYRNSKYNERSIYDTSVESLLDIEDDGRYYSNSSHRTRVAEKFNWLMPFETIREDIVSVQKDIVSVGKGVVNHAGRGLNCASPT